MSARAIFLPTATAPISPAPVSSPLVSSCARRLASLLLAAPTASSSQTEDAGQQGERANFDCAADQIRQREQEKRHTLVLCEVHSF